MGNSQGVVVDTNVLLYVADGLQPFEEVRTQLGGEVKFIVLREVLRELELLSKRNQKLRIKVNVAMEYLDSHCGEWISEHSTGKDADSAILAFARSNGYAVMTNDVELKKKVRDANLTLIFIKGKGVTSTVLS
ncbi:hypothetical protein HS1genome_0338 [Sulfodiicoccus acidiphilus]|uniref:PIN domain-containing protein n=1 Tax=Sulfodiicoccus acidiphilus TaxID=1670455 RepID=A0A348B197_9CREN|nr:PIN domain-containing protein [Sulfodiicoccus acidiphilus]BBD71949.1 hypothetical protein HS1genome_0338 [Sulfodiicoccus acidiphilus]GGT91687.1 hypothetical protein GCM10007116_06760 [Sulfodiicoccus acidiphilus]